MKSHAWFVVPLLGSVFVVGCQNQMATQATQTGFVRFENRPAGPQTLQPYMLEVGDQIDVKLFYHSELNETALIQPDGMIMLQLVGKVEARGQTLEALAKHLTDRYSQAGLRNPAVTVMLRKSTGQRVFVGGEVNSPKMVLYEGRLTLAQALFEAGGLKTTAGQENIVVLRNDGRGGALSLRVDFEKEVVQEGKDVPLQPYDVVVVPKSSIAEVNQFVEQYISKMVPTWVSFGFSYLLGAAAIIP
jgi:protein involved in polysaccharide export with SLBB domain